MATSMVKNVLGEEMFTSYFPCSAVNAKTIAEKYLDGTFEVFSQESQVGTQAIPAGTVGYRYKAQISDSTTGKKGYVEFIAKASQDPSTIEAVLKGLTYNDTKNSLSFVIDTVVSLGFSKMTF